MDEKEFEFIIESRFWDFEIEDSRFGEEDGEEGKVFSYIILSPKSGWTRKLINQKLKSLNKLFKTTIEWDTNLKEWQINIYHS